jgi:hypothetical protein
MKNTTHYLLLATAWLALAACQREDPLPEATQGGKQTFGCRVNGKPFVPDGGTGWNATKPIVVYNDSRKGPNGEALLFYGIEVTSRDGQGMYIIVSEPTRAGIRLLNKEFIPLSWGIPLHDAAIYSSTSGSFITGPTHSGTVVLTRADTTARILSGTFEFRAVNPRTGEVVEVTDGRFDVRL